MHPAAALFAAGEVLPDLPVCDHYAGIESHMRKSLALQAESGEPAGRALFDVTLDAEDGAPVGGEREHAQLIAELVDSPLNRWNRVGARVHPFGHPAFETELELLLRRAGSRLAYLMVPKVADLDEAWRACQAVRAAEKAAGLAREVPIHMLIETHGAVRHAHAIAALAGVESLSFGLMDFVSAHRGAIPASAMGVEGQFEHPLVVRAKLEVAAACHAAGKTPSHCVVTELSDVEALGRAARRASRELGYTRMWSIHPDQIMPIVEAFAPDAADVRDAAEILLAARAVDWAPIRHRTRGRDTLHDRASYRYYWHVLARAHRTGRPLPQDVLQAFFQEHLA